MGEKIFFTVLYRNPMHKAGSPEFFNFIDNFRDRHLKISSEKPYFLIFTGDFNAHSVQWWPNGDSNNEGTQLNLLISMRIQYNGGPMVIAIMKELS